MCRELRRDGTDTPVLMLTARDAVADKVLGLKTGADDYMTKPFECSELLARLEALLRRRSSRAEPAEYAFGDVVVRPVAGQVLRAGQPVRLSAQELKLLTHLVRHPGVLFSRDQLLDAVWGYQATPETRTVDVHVSWLRQKLEPDPHHPRHIVTVFGLGYRFEGPSDQPAEQPAAGRNGVTGCRAHARRNSAKNSSTVIRRFVRPSSNAPWQKTSTAWRFAASPWA